LLAVLAASLFVSDDASLPAAASSPPTIVGEFVPGEVLVGVQERLPETIDVAAAVAGARFLERIPRLGVFRIGLPPVLEVAEAIAIYERFPWVRYAEPNYILRATIVPNDPCYTGSVPLGCASGQSWYYNLLEGPAAWDVEKGNPSIIVAVLDTGIDLNHPDLNDKLVPGAAFVSCIDDPFTATPCDFFPSPGCSPAPTNPQDDDPQGHGTMVGGIVGAESHNAQGVVGTAWRARLMPVKVLDCQGSGLLSDVAQGILHAAENGAKVINMSFASCVRFQGPICSDTGPTCQSIDPSATLRSAVQRAHRSGATLVAAAGNQNCPVVAFPAAYSAVVAVGASGGQSSPNTRASFSNWGQSGTPQIDVVAPGVGICSTDLNDAYGCGSGTSFSTPLVSGLAALILSRDRFATNEGVRFFLCASAVDLPDAGEGGWDGCGRIDMLEALPAVSFVPGISRN
ncbi:MAG: S8 family serine peptidase, partial [Dehalococcoidia bacterium]